MLSEVGEETVETRTAQHGTAQHSSESDLIKQTGVRVGRALAKNKNNTIIIIIAILPTDRLDGLDGLGINTMSRC